MSNWVADAVVACSRAMKPHAAALVVAALVVAALLLPASARAQGASSPSPTPPAPRWDIATSLGYILTTSDDAGAPHLGDSRLEFQASVARYLNTHVRTEVGFSTTTRDNGLAFEDLPGFTGAPIDRRVRLNMAVAAVSYAFFEGNLFIRPYVSGGIRVGALSEHGTHYETLDAFRRGVAVPTSRTSALALPYAAFGVTSYVGSRGFLRSEILTAFGSRGFEHATLRAGYGVYF